MTDDIKLPPLPYSQIPGNDYTSRDMWDYARAAIKYDRQQRGEPVAWMTSDKRHIAFGDRLTKEEATRCGWTPLYTAPQPATPAQEPIVPECWRLVPVQPTHRMLTQMLCGSATPEANYTDFWERRYQAMIEAAPKFGEEQ